MTRDICKEPCKLLQDACLIAGKVKELERENADLRDNYDQFKASAIPEIERLQKENAELKEKVENLQKYLDAQNSYRECADTWLKLTKAKEIISAFVEWANWQGGGCPSFKSIQDKAEQFLKE